jgi:hypothetical protein
MVSLPVNPAQSKHKANLKQFRKKAKVKMQPPSCPVPGWKPSFILSYYFWHFNFYFLWGVTYEY